MEINGFEIDQFNVYNLPVNKRKSTCPLCSAQRKHNPKAECVKLDWSRGTATCYHCGEFFQLHSYKGKNGEVKPNKPSKDYVRKDPENKVSKTYKKPTAWEKGDIPKSFEDYWWKRGISKDTLQDMQVGRGYEWMPAAKKESPVMMFPYYNGKELVNVKFRGQFTDAEGKVKRDFKMISDAQKIPYNLNGIVGQKECIIVEGEPDALTFIECGITYVVSSPNGSTLHSVNLEWLDETIEHFEDKDIIYLGMDNDEAGQNVQKELVRRLGSHRVRLIDYGTFKDANALYQSTYNEATNEFDPSVIDSLISNAKEIPLESVIRFNDVASEVEMFFLKGMPKGMLCGIKELDEVFSINFGQYCMTTGIPTHGKTNLIDQMVLGYNLKYGHRIAFCSPENQPIALHISKLMTKILGYRPEPKDVYTAEFRQCAEYIQDNFDFINFEKGCDLKRTLGKFEELITRRGTKFFVVDPINKIKLKESASKSDVQYSQDYSSDIDTFVKNTQSFMFTVAHPTKQSIGDNKEFVKPNAYSIKGGGDWLDMAYHMLCCHRNFAEGTTDIDVFKCKFEHLGQNGALVKMKYNVANSRLSCLSGSNLDDIESRSPIHDYTNWLTKTLSAKGSEYEYNDKVNWDNLAKPGVENEIPF